MKFLVNFKLYTLLHAELQANSPLESLQDLKKGNVTIDSVMPVQFSFIMMIVWWRFSYRIV